MMFIQLFIPADGFYREILQRNRATILVRRFSSTETRVSSRVFRQILRMSCKRSWRCWLESLWKRAIWCIVARERSWALMGSTEFHLTLSPMIIASTHHRELYAGSIFSKVKWHARTVSRTKRYWYRNSFDCKFIRTNVQDVMYVS